MNQKLIIFATIFMLLISSIFLSVVERNKADINKQNVWMLYFENVQNNSLNFKIENHSKSQQFHWQVSSGKTVLEQGDETIALGTTKKITTSPADIANKKIIISVTSEGKAKEIYKNF
ncbi:MAG: hypothetical protein WCJ51_03510 [Candidatus Moraniibacteriota bacterium]